MPTGKQRRWFMLRKSVDTLTAAIPKVIQLERDLAVMSSTVRRLIGENATLRATNAQLRKMVVDLQMEKVASDARPK